MFALKVIVLQPVVDRMIDSGSVTDQLTVTLVVYQPLSPSVPVITGVDDRRSRIAGDVWEAGGTRREQQSDDCEQEDGGVPAHAPAYFVTTNELLPSGRFAYRAAEIRPYPGQTYQR